MRLLVSALILGVSACATVSEPEFTPSPGVAFRLEDVAGVAVVVGKADGRKCARSWKYFNPADTDPDFPDITPRDADAVREWDATHNG